MRSDLIVVGGGAAGMMAAGRAAELGCSVCLVEKNDRLGRKLRITGKGRCNVTNHCTAREVVEAVPSNGRFLFGALSAFPPEETMRFFEGLGVPLKTERGNRVFPVSDQAADIVDALSAYVRRGGCRVLHGEVRELLLREGRLEGVRLSSGEELHAPAVLVACGGLSYPATGSTGDGYRLARQAGHTVTGLRPSLVPLVEQGHDCAELTGLSLRNIGLSVWDTRRKREVYTDFGELLFTHFGLSGPVILSASSHLRDMEPGRYEVRIDLKPALSPETARREAAARFCGKPEPRFCKLSRRAAAAQTHPRGGAAFGHPAHVQVQRCHTADARTFSQPAQVLFRADRGVPSHCRSDRHGGRRGCEGSQSQNNGIEAPARPVFCRRGARRGCLHRRF